MKKRVTLKELRVIVRQLVEGELEDELERVEVGDMVDVDVDEIGTLPVRVIELVDDVNAVSGPQGAPHGPGADFHGPGFVGEIDPASGESGTLVFSMNQVMPGSKMKGYFPKLGDEFDEDEFGRPTNNPYRKGAKRHAVASISRPGDYLPEADKEEHADSSGAKWDSGLDEADEDHEGDPRWEDHADPTGKEWHSGLDEAKGRKKIGHLSQLKKVNPKAFAGYVEMLIEDCADEFYVDETGKIHVSVMGSPERGGMAMTWDGDNQRVAHTGVGQGWEEDSEDRGRF